jgi:hypothetical protein
MDDMLRVSQGFHSPLRPTDTIPCQVISRFHGPRTIEVHLVETSAHMRSAQDQKLSSRQNITVHWHNSIAEVKPSSEAFTFLVAHEFFDALPVYVIRVCFITEVDEKTIDWIGLENR